MTEIFRSRRYPRQPFRTAQEAIDFDAGANFWMWGQDCPASPTEASGWRFAAIMGERADQDKRDAQQGDLHSERYL